MTNLDGVCVCRMEEANPLPESHNHPSSNRCADDGNSHLTSQTDYVRLPTKFRPGSSIRLATHFKFGADNLGAKHFLGELTF
jgi:hypothetical protein